MDAKQVRDLGRWFLYTLNFKLGLTHVAVWSEEIPPELKRRSAALHGDITNRIEAVEKQIERVASALENAPEN